MASHTTPSPPVAKTDSVVIVGAGVFGLSLALELKQRGYQDVTVLDRYTPPVPDGSSVDISRVIRVEYADPLYGKMAREALEGWRAEYRDHYHESGFVMLCSKDAGSSYIEKSLRVSESLGQRLKEYEDASQIVERYPGLPSNLDGLKAWINEGGGWADAGASIELLSRRCREAGVEFVTGPRGTVRSLKREGNRVVGVNVSEGEPMLASQVVLSTGAWSNTLLPLGHASTASGQPVGFIQLTPEEAAPLRDVPVMINLSVGVFCFPPTPHTNILKLARHGYGFATEIGTHDGRTVSSPKTDSSNADSSYLPEEADEALRAGLRQFQPQFADRPWMNRRLCWYSDTPEGDFVVDHHPDLEGLFVATGGAGQ